METSAPREILAGVATQAVPIDEAFALRSGKAGKLGNEIWRIYRKWKLKWTFWTKEFERWMLQCLRDPLVIGFDGRSHHEGTWNIVRFLMRLLSGTLEIRL